MSRRGVVLFVVMGAVAAGALVGTTILLLADARRESSAAAVGRIETRAIAWSGVQAVTSELAEQREALLAGEDPEVESELTLFEHNDGSRSVVRLLPIGVDGLLLTPESAKLDINHATAEMLGALDAISASTAERIVSRRPYGSVHDLIEIDGVDSSLLYGAGLADRFGNTEAPLVEQLTVFSFDPNVVAGFGDDNDDFIGTRRFNVNLPWTESLADALDERFGEGSAQVVREVLNRGFTFDSDASIVSMLIGMFDLNPESWVEILDAITSTDDEYVLGRVDINRASREVLAAIPGIDSTVARQIIDRREVLGRESRRTPVWPVIEGLMSQESYVLAANHVSARSMQWRVRLEAGVAPPGDRIPAADEFGVLRDESLGIGVELQDRIVVEAVIDLSSQRPRVAELYDVTLLDPLRAVAARLPEPEPEGLSFEPLATADTDDLDPVGETGRGSLDFGDLDVVEPMDSETEPAPTEVSPMTAVDRRIGRWRFSEEQR